MNRTALNGVLSLTLLVGAVLLWRLSGDEKVVVEPAQRSDYVLRDFELTTLDEEGHESFTVRAPYLQRDVAGTSISIVQPRFSFPHSDGEGRWDARADNAWVNPDASEVHLLHDVRMDGPPAPNGEVTSFATERLVVLPDSNQARSDERVTVTRGDSILAGTGLRADMKAKRFELLNQVKGRYAPR